MSYIREARIFLSPLDTPEREQAKKKIIELLQALKDNNHESGLKLVGDIKIDEFCITCRIQGEKIDTLIDQKLKDIDPYDFVDTTIYHNFEQPELEFVHHYLLKYISVPLRIEYGIFTYCYGLSRYSNIFNSDRPYDGAVEFYQNYQREQRERENEESCAEDETSEEVQTVEDVENSVNQKPELKVLNGCLCNIETKTFLSYMGTDKNVVIPDGIKYIDGMDGNAFKTDIKSIKIPKSVILIRRFPFIKLKEFQAPGLKWLGFQAFANTVISHLIFPSTLKIIPKCSFGAKINKVTIKEGCEVIRYEAFDGAKIKKISIPKTIKHIGDSAIPNHTKVILDKGISRYEIRNDFLYDKKRNRCITFCGKKNQIAHIPETTKKFCILKFPKKVSIPAKLPFRSLFKSNWGTPTELYLQDGRISLPPGAFKLCENLEKIVLPKTLKSIPFQSFFSLSLKQIKIPENVTSIAGEAFAFCDNLESIVLPPRLKKISHHLFAECKSLKSVVLSKSIEEIEMGAFYNCESLKSIKLPKNLEKIGYRAFYGCKNLRKIGIPASVKEIGADAFNCDNLILIVKRNSYAAKWAKENGMKYKETK
ncbi:MAG: leucine-rich repeat domain-containing protein [Spirochaetales bacterium]|nr:leucine-rich repeat domain-containing protein [Spirochaetales bacterium]MDY5915331.1 leucine-rich repeat domain-containing protein [Treponema sp.]